jgi:hypothetical protein
MKPTNLTQTNSGKAEWIAMIASFSQPAAWIAVAGVC